LKIKLPKIRKKKSDIGDLILAYRSLEKKIIVMDEKLDKILNIKQNEEYTRTKN